MNNLTTFNKTGGGKRIEFIDLAKGICITLVVMIHCFGNGNFPIFDYLPGLKELRMPLYFVLSGLFFKTYGGWINLAIKKANKLLVPFLFFSIIGYASPAVADMISGNEMSEHLSDNLTLAYDWWSYPLWPNYAIWFLIALFWINIIFYILASRIQSQIALTLAVLAIGISGYVMAIHQIRLPLYISSAFSALPFFYLGYIIKRSDILYPNPNKKRDLIMGLCMVCIGVALSYLFQAHFSFIDNSVEGLLPFIYINSALMVTGVLLLCKVIRYLPYFSYIGRYSIIVLGLHIPMIPWATLAVGQYFKYAGVCNYIVIMAVMPAFVYIFKKYFPWFTAQQDLIRKPSSATLDLKAQQ